MVFPPVFGSRVKAFFTGKAPGIDLARISEIGSVEVRDIFLPIQRHTDEVLVLDSSFEPRTADAVVTRNNGVLIGVQTADCVPVLLYDRLRHATGAVHAGWRGTAAVILKKTLMVMVERFSCAPPDIAVAIGPSIRWCCYEVGYEVIEAVGKATGEGSFFRKKGERYCLDLQAANRYQALSMGIPSENIWVSGECTSCFPERFFSYRYAKGPTGRQGGFIGIQMKGS